ncbi:flagellar basal-body MS-ring/collar protein FliF [Terrilactibacillus laevilacticus]|uniref:Flagellar M-ring protein n=1 Tax=Terrilactibacillus laevilacticus TaxID=1380157 RepID=A0ABW5PPY4_9BACI|nr:flagellar basal-body MS-ring/collar protein FliF [Terrilactibacillus laevilacticus]
MKEKALNLFKLIKEKWQGTSKKQKSWMIGSFLFVIILTIVISMLMSVKHYTPLYSNLSADEAGQIKETLDSKKVPYQLSNGGTTISVPKEEVDRLKVELASQGIPKSGEIDYSFFGKNASFGMTDKEFDVLERAAMQTELAHLITQTKGVKSAKVMINLPDSNVWVGQDADASKASASIVLNLDPGYQLSDNQVQGLYHLVSKSVPNLPEDNIVITDQYFNYYDKKTFDGSSGDGSTLAQYDQQRQIKQDIERGIQQKVSQMLGMMMGNDKVVVNVSTALDFTKQKSTEELVEPVDKQTMDGLQVSSEKITETYSGNGAGGQVGTGNQDVTTYQGNTNSNGNYKKVEERVNNEFNRIHRTIVNSPYTIKDLGIQVMVEPPKPNQPSSLSAQSVNDIKQILNTIIKTSLTDSQGAELDPATISQKSVVSVGKFNGKTNTTQIPKQSNLWFYITGGILLAIIILLIILLLRKRNKDQEDEINDQSITNPRVANLEEAIESDSPEKNKYRQLEQMANQNPTEFVKLLRSWLSED